MVTVGPVVQDLGENLWDIAQKTVGARGFQFSEGCAAEMRAFIQVGVETLTGKGMIDDRARIRDAQDKIRKFVEKMIELSIEEVRRRQASKDAQVIEATSTSILDESSFLSVRSWFCPLFPFC